MNLDAGVSVGMQRAQKNRSLTRWKGTKRALVSLPSRNIIWLDDLESINAAEISMLESLQLRSPSRPRSVDLDKGIHSSLFPGFGERHGIHYSAKIEESGELRDNKLLHRSSHYESVDNGCGSACSEDFVRTARLEQRIESLETVSR